MNKMYPELFAKLVECLRELPGVGEKSAQRYAFFLLNKDEEFLYEFADVLKRVKKELHPCPQCGFLESGDHCVICDDPSREKDRIMVVSYDQDVIAMERTDTFNGLYHVLGGVISAKKGIYPDDLNITGLLKRIEENDITEIIIAISPTIEGETTALYIDKILKDKGVLITRLASGLPMGASLDYADELTLIKALNNRRKFEE